MNIQIFGKSKCFDTKKAERWFKERRIRFQSIDLGKYGISPGELKSVLNAVGLEALVDPKHPDAALLAYLAYDADKVEKLLDNPRLLKTPIVRNSLVGVVLDRFGRDAILVPDGEEHFTVTVPAVVSPQFLGWVFGLGDGVQILRPDWAAEELKRQLAAVAALYQ